MSRRYFINLKVNSWIMLTFFLIFFCFIIFQIIKSLLKIQTTNEEFNAIFDNWLKIFLLIILPFLFFVFYLFLKTKIFYLYFILFYSASLSNFFDFQIHKGVRDYWKIFNLAFNLEDIILTIVPILMFFQLVYSFSKKQNKYD